MKIEGQGNPLDIFEVQNQGNVEETNEASATTDSSLTQLVEAAPDQAPAETEVVKQKQAASLKSELALDGQMAALRVISSGDNSPEVKDLQKSLNEYRKSVGLPLIKEDGIYGQETLKAVSSYQKDIKSSADSSGVLGTWLQHGTYHEGNRGPGVRYLQHAINIARERNGLPPIKEDGIFGQETKKAIRKYQEDNDMEVTGKAGSETYSDLAKELTWKDDHVSHIDVVPDEDHVYRVSSDETESPIDEAEINHKVEE